MPELPSCTDCGKKLKWPTSIRCMSCAGKARKPCKRVPVKVCTGCGIKANHRDGFRGKYGFCRKCAIPFWKKKSGYVALVCPQCQKVFNKAQNIAKKNDKTFCSKKCYDVWKSENLTGNKVHNWKGGKLPYYGPNWHKQRKLARERANNKCEYCDMSTDRALDVHHIKAFRSFGYIKGQNDNYLSANDSDNLIALCFGCHRKAETGKIIIKSRLNISEKPQVLVRFYRV